MLLSLLCTCLLCCCSDEEATEGIRLTGNTPAHQTIYADETTTQGDGIEFSTPGAWTAEITEADVTKAAGSQVGWISLSQYSGDKAGDYTIRVSLSKNYTGADRKAFIKIISGSVLTITVEQKSTTESGDIPAQVDDTYDGKAPYILLESSEISLPASPSGPFFLDFKTNMIDPVIVLELPESEEPAEPLAVIKDVAGPREETSFQLELEIFPNYTDKSRQAELKFLTHEGNLVKSVMLKQEAGAGCQLLAVHSELSSLSFDFKANAQTGFVFYGLSSRLLLSDDAIYEFLGDRNKSKELELGEGEKTFSLSFDNLLPATTYYLYLLPSHEYTQGRGMMVTKEASTAKQESKHDLILEVNANPANEFTVYLPFCDDHLDGTVDWGDGTVEKVTGWNQQGVSHRYATSTATAYEVRFSGTLTELKLVADIRTARENTLLSVKQWGYTGLTKIDLGGFSSLREVAPDTEGAFRNMEHFGIEPYGGSFTGTSITSIPVGFFTYAVNATSFDYTFGDCEKLVSIPDGLFENCTKATSFQRTFISCKQIRSIPEDLFATCKNVSTFWATFTHCEALEEIPANLFANNPGVVSFEATFSGCSRLKSIPGKLFANCPKARYFGLAKLRDNTFRGGSGVFQDCKSLENIPEELFAGNPLAEDFSYAFASCGALASLPQNLFKSASKLKYSEYTFLNCKLLKTIPVSIFDNNRQLASVEGLFAQCYGLGGESPYTVVGADKVHLYEREKYNTEFVAINAYARCFEGCTKLTDYTNLPDNWR